MEASVTGRDWSAFDLHPDPAVVLDGARRVVYANPSARERFPRLAAGTPLLDGAPALRHPAVERSCAEAAAGGGTVRLPLSGADEALGGLVEVSATAAGDGVLLLLHPRSDVSTPEEEHRARVTDGLVRAGMAVSSASSLEGVLQVMADVTRELTGARFAAMGVLNAEGTGLAAFITSGLTPEQHRRMGALPTGHGILGVLIREPRPLRIRNLVQHPSSAGIPANHPHMASFLGVPVMANGRVFGNLYATEKLGADEFSDEDLALVETVAAQSAIAIENAQLRRERDRFFAAASHELGNAVTGVQVWTRHLLRRPPETREALTDALRHIQNGAEHACRLIDDLLSLSKIEEGRLTLDPWRVDVGEVAREAVAQLEPSAESAGVRVREETAPGTPVVEADPVRVRQIIVNLLANAIKFTGEGREIRVEVGPLPDSAGVLVAVRDEGPGIAAEDRERIFEPYQQVSGVARGRGTGLGLPLSRRLARLMGGELWVESEVGHGSSFFLRLPLLTPTGGVLQAGG